MYRAITCLSLFCLVALTIFHSNCSFSLIVSQSHRANLGRFFNSAPKTKANAVAVRRVHHGRVRIFIVLVRDVKIGDEITFPYGADFEIENTGISAGPVEIVSPAPIDANVDSDTDE